MTSNLCIHF